MKVPRLIQRCMFENGRLRFHDMGSSVVEWGAKNSLRRIFNREITRVETNINFGGNQLVKVEMVAGLDFDFRGYQPYLQRIAEGDATIRFLATPRFRDEIEFWLGLKTPTKFQPRTNVWFDIENDVLLSIEKGIGPALAAWLQLNKERLEKHSTASIF